MNNHCLKCNATDSLIGITSRACGNSYISYPSGEELDGYLPNIRGLCDSDGLMIQICIQCGQLHGLDLVKMREQLLAVKPNN